MLTYLLCKHPFFIFKNIIFAGDIFKNKKEGSNALHKIKKSELL